MSGKVVVQPTAAKSVERTSIFERLGSQRGGRAPLVRDLMSTDVLVSQITDSCAEVAERMRQGNVGMLPVMDGRVLVGVVTDRDLALRHLASGARVPTHNSVAGCMTPKVVSVASDLPLEEAIRTMHEEKVRRLLVVDDGTLQGILTLDDVFVETGTSVESQRVIQEALVGSRGSARP